MNIKRYTAATMAEAMAEIRRELGPDAFILSQRNIRAKGLKGFFTKPMVEVMAAYEVPEPERPAAVRQSNPLPSLVSQPASRPSRVTAYNAQARPIDPRVTAAPEPRNSELGYSADRALEMLEKLSSIPEKAPPLVQQPTLFSKNNESEGFKPAAFSEVTPRDRVIGKAVETEAKIATLENKIDTLSESINTLVGKMHLTGETRSYGPDIDQMTMCLLENETHQEFVTKLTREVNDIVAKKKEQPREVMEQLLRQYIGLSDPIKLKRYKRTVVMLVGPTGVGKTTSLAKLAAIYAINHHAKVGVVTTDTYRIAAVDQLKTYTQILEIPMSIVYSPEEIGDALREHEDKDVVFIDTAGKSPSDRTHEEELKELIRASDCDEIHLVVSATTSFSGLLNILGAYTFLTDFKLIITKLDETPGWGTILNARFLSDRPLSYIADGQTVPDDIEVADAKKIVDRLLKKD